MEQEAFNRWQRLPETREFFDYLWRIRLIAMEDWAHRAFLGETPEESNRKNDHALGMVEALTNLLFIKHSDIESAISATGGIGEFPFKYPTRREDHDPQDGGVGSAGEAGSGGDQVGPY